MLILISMVQSINEIWEFLKKCDQELLLVNSKTIYKYLHFHLHHNYPTTKEGLYLVRDILDLMASMAKYEGGMTKQIRQSLYNKLSQQMNSKYENEQVEAEETASSQRMPLRFKLSVDAVNLYIQKYSRDIREDYQEPKIDETNKQYAALASSADLQSQETSQLCLNCMQQFDSHWLPITPHPYLLLEYNENTIQRQFCRYACALLNSGTGCLFIVAPSCEQSDNDEPQHQEKLRGIDLATLKTIAKLDNQPLIQEFFEERLQSYFFKYFRHNFWETASKEKNIKKQQMNRYIRIQLAPLKDKPNKYVIKIALKANSIHKVYSVRHQDHNNKFESIFTYFITNNNEVEDLSGSNVIYEYAHLIHRKAFKKSSQVCNSYGACQYCQNGALSKCKHCQDCQTFGRVYHRKNNFNADYLDIKGSVANKKVSFQISKSIHPDLRYKRQSILLINNIKKETQSVKLAQVKLCDLNFCYCISKPYQTYNENPFKAVYVISHKEQHESVRGILDKDNFTKMASLIAPKRNIRYALQKKPTLQNKKISNDLQAELKQLFKGEQAEFNQSQGFVNTNTLQNIKIMQFNSVKQGIFAFVFLQGKVEKVIFISDSQYDRLREDIQKYKEEKAKEEKKQKIELKQTPIIQKPQVFE